MSYNRQQKVAIALCELAWSCESHQYDVGDSSPFCIQEAIEPSCNAIVARRNRHDSSLPALSWLVLARGIQMQNTFYRQFRRPHRKPFDQAASILRTPRVKRRHLAG